MNDTSYCFLSTVEALVLSEIDSDTAYSIYGSV